jgi:NAD(P)-dependent dehydrogenase (short-subunit alcohol dehydrogenase family)
MKTVIITGATSGIGLETARLLANRGYRVFGVGHSEKNCIRAEQVLLTENPNAQISFHSADLMQQRQVLRVAEELSTELDRTGGELYALINNAGAVRSWYTTTEEGYEQQFALNHLAGFLLTAKLLPYLQKTNGRVIMTGSGSHKGIKIHWDDVMLRRGYNPLIAYKQSKLCNILFAKGLNDRNLGISAYTVDPGLVKTDIGNKQTGGLVNLIWSLRKNSGVSPEIPAKTYFYLCEQDPAPTGLYYYHNPARRPPICEMPYSKQVTSENAARLFSLSERLCGIKFETTTFERKVVS